VEIGSRPEGEGSSVQSMQRLGMMIYADFAGQERFDGMLLENSVPWWWWHGPVQGRAMVENTGNTHFYGYYTLQTKPWWGTWWAGADDDEGWELVYEGNNLIMPGTRRLVLPSWTDPPAVGVYHVRQSIGFLDQESVVGEVVVILSPILVISVAAFVSLGVIFFSWRYWREDAIKWRQARRERKAKAKGFKKSPETSKEKSK
jgi:hypothetical protein